jgi:hypothetical protein
MYATAADFTEAHKMAFVNSIISTLDAGVSADQVSVAVSLAGSRRRLGWLGLTESGAMLGSDNGLGALQGLESLQGLHSVKSLQGFPQEGYGDHGGYADQGNTVADTRRRLATVDVSRRRLATVDVSRRLATVDVSRRLATVDVSYVVTGLTPAVATTASTAMSTTTPAAFATTLSLAMVAEALPAFTGTVSAITATAVDNVPTPAPAISSSGSRLDDPLVLGLGIGCVVCVLLLLCVIIARCRNRTPTAPTNKLKKPKATTKQQVTPADDDEYEDEDEASDNGVSAGSESLALYKELLEMAMNDGVMEASESHRLSKAKKRHGITSAQHDMLLAEVAMNFTSMTRGGDGGDDGDDVRASSNGSASRTSNGLKHFEHPLHPEGGTNHGQNNNARRASTAEITEIAHLVADRILAEQENKLGAPLAPAAQESTPSAQHVTDREPEGTPGIGEGEGSKLRGRAGAGGRRASMQEHIDRLRDMQEDLQHSLEAEVAEEEEAGARGAEEEAEQDVEQEVEQAEKKSPAVRAKKRVHRGSIDAHSLAAAQERMEHMQSMMEGHMEDFQSMLEEGAAEIQGQETPGEQSLQKNLLAKKGGDGGSRRHSLGGVAHTVEWAGKEAGKKKKARSPGKKKKTRSPDKVRPPPSMPPPQSATGAAATEADKPAL